MNGHFTEKKDQIGSKHLKMLLCLSKQENESQEYNEIQVTHYIGKN